VRRDVAGALAGALGGAAWLAADRPLQALLGTSYSDARVTRAALGLIGLPRSRRLADAGHLALCAGAGVGLARLPPRVPVLAAGAVELAAAWPLVRRLDRRTGERFDDGARAFAEAAAGRLVLLAVASGFLRRLGP
jgi:hypothetical protein